jgi:hypothetical protein
LAEAEQTLKFAILEAEMKQLYEVLDIFQGKPFEVTVEAVIDDWEGFRLILREHKSGKVFRISFETHVAYQNRDESDFAVEASQSDGLGGGFFYRVKNSMFLKRFTDGALNPYIGLEHFAVISESDCIDVLAIGGEKIEFL